MKKLYAITTLLLSLLHAEAQVTFMKHYGGGLDQAGYAVKECIDGGYIAVGYHNSGIYHPYILRIDSVGTIVWSKIFYGGVISSVAFDIIQTSDSGFLFTGYYNAAVPQLRMMKLSPNGDSLWNRVLGTNQWGQAVVLTPDAGYMVAGAAMYRTDSVGILLWQNPWSNCQLMHIVATTDGGYAMVGKTGNTIYLYKTDSAGTLSWTKILDGRLYNPVNNVLIQTQDGGYAIAGNSVITDTQFLIRTDANGDTLWTRTFAGYYGAGIVEQENGNLALAGSDHNSIDMHLTILDSSGMILWMHDYGYVGDEWCQSIAATRDGGYILCGTTTTFSSVDNQLLIVKTDSSGHAFVVGIPESPVNDVGKVYPNPAGAFTMLQLETEVTDATLKIFSLNGEMLRTERNVSGNIIRIQRNELSAGVYLAQLCTEDGSIISVKIAFVE